MATLQDLENRVNLLQARLDALAPAGPGIRYFAQMSDVQIGAVTPLVDGNAVVYNATQDAYVNGSAASSYPLVHDDGTATYSTTATGLALKNGIVVDGTGQNAYAASAANTTTQQSSMHADDNAGHVAQVDAIVASGAAVIFLTAAAINVGTLPGSAGASGDLYAVAGIVHVSP